ncbi:hypothetical protein D7V80_36555 [Corallococcus sp. CA054B]|uniref:NAD(P)-binding protein n=1 Tax=Corallococcus sp. CA054B TaxID=2316734 RepID=UPI000EA3B6F6|nr:NAD(P)-binding protein [Corallococcus sp. CA054B]RKG60069.1 hypothetical protein D7V80_36555 [Corallococcus sp. CA054B]
MKTRIAILGSGCGAMAAAFELTATPERRARYDITVYQQGWRLGGKGASGRDANHWQRIEEHGLHVFMGFYDHAFRLMRDCYREWKDPHAPFQSFQDAVMPQHLITFQEQEQKPDHKGQEWRPWNIKPLVRAGLPGEGASLAEDRSYKDMMRALREWIFARAREAEHREDVLLPLHEAGESIEKLPESFEDAQGLDAAKGFDLSFKGEVLKGIQHLEQTQQAERAAPPPLEKPEPVRRAQLLFRLGVAALKGWLTDLVWKRKPLDFLLIDGLDFRAWLRKYGANPEDAQSAPITALYCLGFATLDGNPRSQNARASAGVCFHVLLSLLFDCKGAPLWKFRAGMGDILFAPLYEVLRARGVKFEFFQRVQSLGLTPDRSRVGSIQLLQQVKLTGPEYQPLIRIKLEDGKQLPCWPSEPDWKQLVDGEALREKLADQGLTLESAWCAQQVGERTLRLNEDFDLVVFGISLGSVPSLCGELLKADKRWAAMAREVKTVQTQALQLWLTCPIAVLGWSAGPTISTAYVEPFDTWGDMSHLVKVEHGGTGPGAPKSIHYFCGALPDTVPLPPPSDIGFPARMAQQVKRNAIRWILEHMKGLWPLASPTDATTGMDWLHLADPSGRMGEARMDAQYWRANIDPSERYVLSVPGSAQYRLPAGGSGFTNLFLAGDWVQTRLNAGCAEAAVEGGLNAARAVLKRHPPLPSTPPVPAPR